MQLFSYRLNNNYKLTATDLEGGGQIPRVREISFAQGLSSVGSAHFSKMGESAREAVTFAQMLVLCMHPADCRAMSCIAERHRFAGNITFCWKKAVPLGFGKMIFR
jgi:hypothetical protein